MSEALPSGPPVLVARVAGLATAAMEDLGTDLGARIEAQRELEGELAKARADLVDRLYAAIPGKPRPLRRFLLAVKRDSFNGRPISQHRERRHWSRLIELVGSAAERVLELEAEHDRWTASLRDAYARAWEQQRCRLLEHLEDRALMRGIALASPVAARNAYRLRQRDAADYGRRERRLLMTLLRYVSRSALKVSPYSTFTRVGFAVADDRRRTVTLDGAGRREISVVRLKRYLLDQYASALLKYGPIRSACPIRVNDSMCEFEPGRYLFLVPGHWKVDQELGKHRYVDETLVKVRLGGPLVAHLLASLAATRPTYSELIRELTEKFGERASEDQIVRQVEQLIDIGALRLLAPWPSDACRFERVLLEHLRTLPPTPELDVFIERLERLVSLEDGFAAAERPAESLRAIDRSIGDLWRAAAPLGGISPQIRHAKASEFNVYEDVFHVAAEQTGGAPAIVTIPATAAREALDSALPLIRWANLFSHRHDFLATLKAFAGQRWPERSRVPAIEAFEAVQPLWQDYVRFLVKHRDAGGWRRSWNPLDQPAIATLADFRERSVERLDSCLTPLDGCDQEIDGAGLERLLDGAPSASAELTVGGCLFLQPADRRGRLWMLNRLKEGTGRYGSRYTPAMGDGGRERYLDRLLEHGRFRCGEEEVELLDIHCPQGDTLNVHAAQTPKILVPPGFTMSLEPARQLTWSDLVVDFGAAGGPVLRDLDGQRYLPIHLGVAHEDFMPTLLKFLCVFGPSELTPPFPPQRFERRGDVEVGGRSRIGNLLIHRRSWSCAPAPLLDELSRHDEADAFVAGNRWRSQLGIPERVFAIEKVPHRLRGTRYQPQYVDFTSPLFLDVLRAVLKTEDASVTFMEVLPTPDMFAEDGTGQRRAVEVLLDDLSCRAPCFEARTSLPRLAPAERSTAVAIGASQ